MKERKIKTAIRYGRAMSCARLEAGIFGADM
jgi:hypothetical protein